MCVVSKLENNKAFTIGLAKFKEDNPAFFEELKLDPRKEALIEIDNVLTPFSLYEIEVITQEIMAESV